MRESLHKWLGGFWPPSEMTTLISLSILVGAATGVGASAFIRLVEAAGELFFGYSHELLTKSVPFDWRFWVPLIPVVGGLLVGPIVYLYAREARGHGVPEVMAAVARKGGIIRPRVASAKAVASAICIGSGGSAGREGPIVQIGSALGSVVGQRFHMSGDLVKILVGCGAAGGIASVFNAPIAGVLFSLEIILGDFGIGTFAPVILAAVVSSVVSHLLVGDYQAFTIPKYTLISAWELPLYALLGVLAAVVGRLFVIVLYWLEDLFDGWRIPGFLKPACGGLLLGLLGIPFPQVFADGYPTISRILLGQGAFWLLLTLVGAKILATSLTLGSGNSGGIFAPSLFMGAAFGAAFGHAAHYVFPTVTAGTGAYATVAMGAVVAAATHAPMTAFMIIFEMTRDYSLVLPLMVTCVIATVFAMRLSKESIYTLKLVRQGITLRRGRDLNVLARNTVSEAMTTDFETLPLNLGFSGILERLEQSSHSNFLVVDPERRLVGMIGLQEIRSILTQPSLDSLVIVADVMRPLRDSLFPDDSLSKAWELFLSRENTVIPVVSRSDSRDIAGILTKETITGFYNRRLLEDLAAPGSAGRSAG